VSTPQAQQKTKHAQSDDVATRTETIKLRLTAEDLTLIDSAAAHVNLSRSAWVRMVARQAAYRHLAFRELPPLVLDRQAGNVIITEEIK